MAPFVTHTLGRTLHRTRLWLIQAKFLTDKKRGKKVEEKREGKLSKAKSPLIAASGWAILLRRSPLLWFVLCACCSYSKGFSNNYCSYEIADVEERHRHSTIRCLDQRACERGNHRRSARTEALAPPVHPLKNAISWLRADPWRRPKHNGFLSSGANEQRLTDGPG